MKLLYTGKTKDVYQKEDNLVLLHFKDDVTGLDGSFDPGANQVGLSVEGMGRLNLLMTSHFFDRLKELKIPTHYISSDYDTNTMVVKAAKILGQGIEVITRYRAVGSFIRRYGAYIKEGAPLDAYVEITLKDDERQDPLITQAGLIVLGIMTQSQYEEMIELNLKITAVIQEELAQQGLELYDIKLEFGYDHSEDNLMLIDEISGGNMRVYHEGKYIEPLTLANYFVIR